MIEPLNSSYLFSSSGLSNLHVIKISVKISLMTLEAAAEDSLFKRIKNCLMLKFKFPSSMAVNLKLISSKGKRLEMQNMS